MDGLDDAASAEAASEMKAKQNKVNQKNLRFKRIQILPNLPLDVAVAAITFAFSDCCPFGHYSLPQKTVDCQRLADDAPEVAVHSIRYCFAYYVVVVVGSPSDVLEII